MRDARNGDGTRNRATEERDLRFDTRAVHAGERRPRPETPNGEGAGFYPVSTPIYASTTFSHRDIQTTERVLGGEEHGYSYARYDNPTVRAFEDALGSLEGTGGDHRAFAFASGMAAMHAALLAAETTGGATVLAAEQLYGSTATLLVQIFGPMGVEVRFVDCYDLDAVEKRLGDLRPRAFVVESISNPLMRVADVPALAERAAATGTALVVDNTFGTPYLQRPLELGADIVVHSATKYLSGHGDLTAGAVCAGPPYDAALETVRKLVGGVLAPLEAWLALRGMKTLSLRMERQCASARELALRLTEHPAVAAVNYPALDGHPDAGVAGRVLDAPGGMLSFELATDRADRDAAFRFLNALGLCVRAPSLGDIYTLAIHPASTSHRELSPGRRERLGVGENLIRLSCGIEDVRDVYGDIAAALDAV